MYHLHFLSLFISLYLFFFSYFFFIIYISSVSNITKKIYILCQILF